MTLTRRQVIALLLGAAAGPAIAAPEDDLTRDKLLAMLAAIQVGDVLTFGNDPMKWRVAEVYPPGGERVARIELTGVYALQFQWYALHVPRVVSPGIDRGSHRASFLGPGGVGICAREPRLSPKREAS
jgi:hypothetical protein